MDINISHIKNRLRPDELRHDRIDSLFRVARQEAMVQKVQRVKRINFRCYNDNVSQVSAITKAFHSHQHTPLSTYFLTISRPEAEAITGHHAICTERTCASTKQNIQRQCCGPRESSKKRAFLIDNPSFEHVLHHNTSTFLLAPWCSRSTAQPSRLPKSTQEIRSPAARSSLRRECFRKQSLKLLFFSTDHKSASGGRRGREKGIKTEKA